MKIYKENQHLNTEFSKTDLPKLVNLFKKTKSNCERNDLAMIISDLNGSIYVPEMIKILKKNSTTSKGTIIYAISRMGASEYISDISNFLFSDNLEVLLEATSFIMKFKKKSSTKDLLLIKTKLMKNKNALLPKKVRKNLLRGLNYEIKKN